MVRIPGVSLDDDLEAQMRNVFEGQARIWGAPLLSHMIYARRPGIFRGMRAMWTGLSSSGLLDAGLHALVNRRVAQINGCVF
jgi:alkylhydroperoxidase family enzyme